MIRGPGHRRLAAAAAWLSGGRRRALLGAAAGLLALPGAWVDLQMFAACWLTAWWFLLGTVLGALVNLWIHALTGGAWGRRLRGPAALLAARLPAVLLLFLPLTAALPLLYPWAAEPAGAWAAGRAEPGFARAWMAPGAVGLRLVVYAAVWWALSRHRARGRRPQRATAARALMLHGLLGSLCVVDLVMSLQPGWYSTAFGLVVLCGQALGGAAALVLLRAWRSLRRPPTPVSHADAPPPQRPGTGPAAVPWRDFGNLLLMWLMTWAYLAFMEFLIIWAEDLPRETVWFRLRQQGWGTVGVALAVLQLALPLMALLWRVIKDQPARLAVVAAWLLLGQWLNTAWLVLPSVRPDGWLAWWLLPALTLSMGLLLSAGGRVAGTSGRPVSFGFAGGRGHAQG